jgi:DNA-directed RNA polymerase specialized sigma24 family protein
MAAAASDDQPVAASDDRADVAAAVAGDAAAYARLVRRHQSAIARRMARFDRSAVEELTQEVFVQAYLSLDRYRGDAPLDHWLQRLATRVGYRHWQARAKRAHRPLPTWRRRPRRSRSTTGRWRCSTNCRRATGWC